MPQGTQAAGRWGHTGSPGRAQDGQDAPGPAALPTGDGRSEAEPGRGARSGRGCVSLTSQPPRVGCDSPRERLAGKCHSGAASPLYSTPHIPWSFPAGRGLVPETGCPRFPGLGQRCSQPLCAGPGKLVATPRTVPGVTLTHGGTYTKTQSCCVNGLLGGGCSGSIRVFLVAVKCNLINSASDLHKRRDPYSWVKIHGVLGKTESKRRRGKRGAKVPHCRPFPP